MEETTQEKKAGWYIVHTYSGHENKVAATLKQRVQSMNLEKKIQDVLVPTRETIKVRSGKKENIKEKIFFGYFFCLFLGEFPCRVSAWFL